MMLTLTIIHVVISLLLVLAVLMQHGKQQGLSGAIAGGAETFFGKNKGRTIDAVLKKVTAVIAILFIVSSLALAAVAVNTYNAENPATEETGIQASLDEAGNLVDEAGNVLMTAEEIAEQQANVEATPFEGDVVPEEEATSAE